MMKRRTLIIGALCALLVLLGFGGGGYLLANQSTTQDAATPGIVAHRGGTTSTPENTLAAFRASIQRGYDFVETDLRMTADGVPVLMHDSDVRRTTDGSGAVAQLTLAELRTLDAGSWFSQDFKGERVPTLDELADLLAHSEHTKGLIEFKGKWGAEQMKSALAVLRKHNLTGKAVLMGFDQSTLKKAQTYGPEFARVLLVKTETQDVLKSAKKLGVWGVGSEDIMDGVAPATLRVLRKEGIALFEYTLDAQDEWQRATEARADFIITDNPAGLARWQRVAGG